VLKAALLIGVAAMSVLLAGCGGSRNRVEHRYTFTVSSVNPNPTFKLARYVTLASPVVLPRKQLKRAPLFNDVTAGIYLVKHATHRGLELCSFSTKIKGSSTFPQANGKTIKVKVYGTTTSPTRTADICRAFRTFSLSYG